jgi:hypothetical protein
MTMSLPPWPQLLWLSMLRNFGFGVTVILRSWVSSIGLRRRRVIGSRPQGASTEQPMWTIAWAL